MWKHRKYTGEDDEAFDVNDMEDFEEEERTSKFAWKRRKAPTDMEEGYDTYDQDEEFEGRRSRRKGPGLIAVVAVIAAVVVLLVSLMPKGGTLYQAVRMSGEELLGHTGSVSVLPDRLVRMEELWNGGDYTMGLSLQMPTLNITVEADYSARHKKMDGALAVGKTGEPWQVAMEFRANQKKMYFEAPGLVQDAYGFTLEDFNQRFEGSAAFEIFPVKGLRLHLFRPTDLRGYLKRAFGSDWDAFEKTLKTEKFDTREFLLGERTEKCTVYRVSWGPAAAEKLLAKSTGPLQPLTNGLLSLIPDLEPEFRLFLDSRDRLVGCDFSTPIGKYTLLLEGQENVWESISLEVLYINGASRHLTGEITEVGELVQLQLADEAGTYFLAAYNNTTGDFQVIRENAVLLEGSLKEEGDTVKLELSLGGDAVLSMALKPLQRQPEGPTRKYLELLDLTPLQKTRLLAELLAGAALQ